MQKIQEWNPKFFTLAHVPEKYRLTISKFIRRVVIARMAESPDLASAYHRKLKEAYETEDKLKNPEVVKRSKEHLVQLLEEVETKLSETSYLGGEEFSMADAMLIPVLARLVLLNLEDEYISSRPNIAEYWILVQQRPSYRKVIGRYFNGWRRYKTLIKTWSFVRIRSLLRKFWWKVPTLWISKFFVPSFEYFINIMATLWRTEEALRLNMYCGSGQSICKE